MNLKKLSEAKKKAEHRRLCIIWFHLYGMPMKSKTTETESRLVVFWVGSRNGGLTKNENEGYFLGDRYVLKLDYGNDYTTL